MHSRMDSADFTYRFPLVLHVLRAGARAAEVVITVIDRRGMKDIGTRLLFIKGTCLRKVLEFFVAIELRVNCPSRVI